jgi:glycosidase
MKHFFIALLCSISLVHAQIVKIIPADAGSDQEVEIIYDATQGTAGLKGAASVYIHTGVIVDSPSGENWTSVVGNWGKDDGIGKMTKVAGSADLWSLKMKSIRQYYGLSADAIVFRLSMVFRNADGSKEGKGTPGAFVGGNVAANQDIFLNLKVGNFLQINDPKKFTVLLKQNEAQKFNVSASSKADSIILRVLKGTTLVTSKVSLNTDLAELTFPVAATGSYTIEAYARWKTETQKISKTLNVVVVTAIDPKALPTGAQKGINYIDNSKVRLVLEAPKKQIVYAVGDFSSWQVNETYRMMPTPDGKFFWLDIAGLTSGKDYVFQYWVDAEIKIADPYADQVADPYNDGFIPQSLYPNLPAYNKLENGIASVFRTGQIPYVWAESEKTFKKSPKSDMIIYELLLRDFVGTHSYKTLVDTLSYLKKLGVNTIELMPIMEFEGNESWGYNPSHFFAPDKYYGNKNDLKRFIEKAHEQGFTVLLDMVLNHAFGQNPLVKLYWDEAKNKPATDNPWFNPDATHPFNVGYDFNHESAATQAFVDSVNTYWLKEYHFDGFRFDLSKGFTQKVNTDVGLWSAKDDSRIKLLKRMNAQIKKVDPAAIVILEHFADDAEEAELHLDGMLTWGNGTFGYGNLLNGSNDGVVTAAANLNKVFYMESHDEERLWVKGVLTNAKNATQSFSDSLFVSNKIKQLSAFFFPLPGPKMLWQFQELGYNKSIDFNGRVGNKPLPWGLGSLGLYADAERQKLLKATSALINLVSNNRTTFNISNYKGDLSGDVKTYSYKGTDLSIVAVGNFGKNKTKANFTLLNTGKWYEYFGRDSLNATSTAQSVDLYQGNFRIYTSKKILVPTNLVSDMRPIVEIDKEAPTAAEEITLTFHANLAVDTKTDAINKQTALFLVTAPVTDGPNSTKTGTTVGQEMNSLPLTRVTGTDDWTIKINPKTLFGIAGADNLNRMALYVRNTNSTAEGKGYDKGWLYVNFKNAGTIVTISPEKFDENTAITITFDASAADAGSTAGLIGSPKVYMHSGIISESASSTSWKYVVGNWGKDDGLGAMTKVAGTEKWQIQFTPKTYYKTVPTADKWFRIGMVFRNADGTKEGKDTGGKDIFFNFTAGVTTQAPLANEPVSEVVVIYPNPNVGKFSIRSKEAIEQLLLFDSNGRLLKNLDVSKTEHSIQKGLFYIQIHTKKSIYVQKVVGL